MADKEFNLEDWWEESQDELHDLTENLAPFILPFAADDDISQISIVGDGESTWGDVGTVGGFPALPEGEMEDALYRTYKNLQKISQADEWFYVIRRSSDRYDVKDYLRASEKILYASKTSMAIQHYAALPTSEIYFHVLRAFTRAEEGDFEAAKTLWLGIHEDWLHHLNDYHKPYLLSHLYLTSICTKEWEQSIRYLRQLWAIVKFMDGAKRHTFGVWDEWTVCLLTTWIFMKHSTEFCKFFCDTYSGQFPFDFQKKSIILKNLDVAFLADVIEKPYYELARKNDPSLPKVHYEEKEVAKLRL